MLEPAPNWPHVGKGVWPIPSSPWGGAWPDFTQLQEWGEGGMNWPQPVAQGLGFGNLALGEGTHIYCHCTHAVKFSNPWEAPLARYLWLRRPEVEHPCTRAHVCSHQIFPRFDFKNQVIHLQLKKKSQYLWSGRGVFVRALLEVRGFWALSVNMVLP